MVKTDQTNCETTAEPNEAIDGPDSGYDIVVDDDTVSHELFNNQGMCDRGRMLYRNKD